MSSVLGAEWHISSSGHDFLTKNGTISDKQQLYNCALNTDLKEICSPVLNDSFSTSSKIVLQIHKIRNISAPKANEESQAAPRMLKLTLTDGDSFIQALELSTIGTINSKNTSPGTKLLIQDAKVVSGFLLLTPQNCKVLGGKVASLIEKWELTRSVQRNRKTNGEDGPPLWVNFGTKIQNGNQGDNFKSLQNKNKDGSKENSEFEQQRQDAIAEASSGAVRKVFSGRVKQNVQVQNNTNRKVTEKSKEKKELTKGRGKLGREKGEVDDKPQKPSEKVSLFAFLEDKLPVNTKEDTFYQNQPIKTRFKDTETYFEDPNNYDYRKKKTPMPKQFEKPEYSNKKGPNIKKLSNNSYSQSNSSYPELTPLKYTTNSVNYSDKPKNFNCNEFKSQQVTKMQQNNSFKSLPQNSQLNYHCNPSPIHNSSYRYEYNDSSVQQLNSNYQYQQKPISNNYSNPPPVHYQRPYQNNYQHNPEHISSSQQDSVSNSNTLNRKPQQRQIDINHINQEVQKISLNSQFASRSLRQHLNLGSSPRKSNEATNKVEDNGPIWNIGDEILAKYWEDGKYYNATIISITDKTFAVRFKGYGNIEEILKTDCLPIMHNNTRSNNGNQQYDKNKQYSGPMEFRRTSKNYK